MKKTFLSLAFVLSISLAFANNEQPKSPEIPKALTSTKNEVAKKGQQSTLKASVANTQYCASGTMCGSGFAACANSIQELFTTLAELAELLCGTEEGGETIN